MRRRRRPRWAAKVTIATAALAFGYDWLHAELSAETRTKLRRAIVEKGLNAALDPAAKHNGWQKADNNWNQVCFGGLILGALAVGDEEPEIAGKMLTLARSRIASGLKMYAPDGAYPEGPAYWSYGTSYSALTVAALETAIGTDWGISASPGFLASASFVLQATGPSGRWFNYADTVETGSFEPILFWFARRLGNPWLIESQRADLTGFSAKSARSDGLGEAARFLPFAAIWWPIGETNKGAPLPLRWRGDGPNPVAVFRSAWGDPQAFYLGIKGGAANLSHAHMDAGSFVLEANGVRWARDLGRQEYNSLESKGVDLWNRKQDSQRWQVFRLNNRSHNTLTIDGQLHRVNGDARIISFSDTATNPFAIMDLTPVFSGQAGQVRRGFRVQPEGAVLVQDELTGLKPAAALTWTMATAAEVAIEDNGRRAILRESGQTCEVRLLEPTPADARLKVIAADPPVDGFNAANPGRRLLLVESVAPSNGAMTLAVWIIAPDAQTKKAPTKFAPLSQWGTAAGTVAPTTYDVRALGAIGDGVMRESPEPVVRTPAMIGRTATQSTSSSR